jgi:2-amino-4-hydroxy-6-hydroxymethyldihydropteridine diphosphokinase
VGDRAAYLALARARLAALPRTRVLRSSRVEETLPLGPIAQGPFLNQMVLLETALEPGALWHALLDIESAAGRVRAPGARWGPRTLDLDIVRFGDRRLQDAELTVPHPELANREFWRREIAEIEAMLHAPHPTPHAR